MPSFCHFFSVFLFASVMSQTAFDGLRRTPQILWGTKYRIEEMKEIITHQYVIRNHIKTEYKIKCDIKQSCNGWHIFRRIIVFLVTVVAEVSQNLFTLHVGIK